MGRREGLNLPSGQVDKRTGKADSSRRESGKITSTTRTGEFGFQEDERKKKKFFPCTESEALRRSDVVNE